MTRDDDFIGQLEGYLDEYEGDTPLPDAIRNAVRAQLSTTKQIGGSAMPMRFLTMIRPLQIALAAVAVAAIVLLGVNLLPGPNVGDEPSPSVEPSPDLVSFDLDGAVILGTSSDGTWLLISRGDRDEKRLFVLYAGGSETQVTEQPMQIRGVTFAPDGSRVVFAGGTGEFPGEPGSCCSGGFALYAVDADGGPAEVLVAGKGIVERPAFSPDGSWVAYVDGAGDNSHHVWLIGADGSGAHEILFKDCACHVNRLAWSPAGDRITLVLEGITYSFASDGSDFRRE